MFRLWGKIYTDNHLVKDMVVENQDYSVSRTRRVFDAITEICRDFDLGEPMWLDLNISDFKRHSKCRFTQDSFVEQIDFDYLEIQVIEE